jgi:hypothetical protein
VAGIFRHRREKQKHVSVLIVAVEAGREAPGLKQPISYIEFNNIINY